MYFISSLDRYVNFIVAFAYVACAAGVGLLKHVADDVTQAAANIGPDNQPVHGDSVQATSSLEKVGFGSLQPLALLFSARVPTASFQPSVFRSFAKPTDVLQQSLLEHSAPEALPQRRSNPIMMDDLPGGWQVVDIGLDDDEPTEDDAMPAPISSGPPRGIENLEFEDTSDLKGAFGIDIAEAIYVKKGTRTFMMGARIKQEKYKTLDGLWNFDDSLNELERLCETSGMEIVGRDYQTMQHPTASTFIGSGKLEELKGQVDAAGATAVVFDDELSPAQSQNIQKALGGTQVLDRTRLILNIFGQRAQTREAKLEVQSAQMEYMLPRLQTYLTAGAGMDATGGGASTGGGGQFLKGTGETQIEMDRRLFRDQIVRINAEIRKVKDKRDLERAQRRKKDLFPPVCIVGYTNAGKSTLLNEFAGQKPVYADDLLFATLDTTARRVELPAGRKVRVSDTVGFIQKLPTKLVASFRATLDELADAAVVLHVIDASSKLAKNQVQSVQDIIDDMGAGDVPLIFVLNKADAASEETLEELTTIFLDEYGCDDVVETSALNGDGLDTLKVAIERQLHAMESQVLCILPYSETGLVNEVRNGGTLLKEEYGDEGVKIAAYVPESLRNRLKKVALKFKSKAPKRRKLDVE